jgi:hypothetical protein
MKALPKSQILRFTEIFSTRLGIYQRRRISTEPKYIFVKEPIELIQIASKHGRFFPNSSDIH